MTIKRTPTVKFFQFAICQRKYSEVAIYLWLNFHASGHVSVSAITRTRICQDIGITDRTLRKCLKWLHLKNWIGRSKDRKKIYVRSIDTVRKIMRWKSRVAVIMYPSHLRNFKSFAASALLTYMIIHQENKIRRYTRNAREPHKKVSSSQGYTSLFYPLSINAFSKYFSFSHTNAHVLKKMAVAVGFIEEKSNHKVVNTGEETATRFIRQAMQNDTDYGQRLFINNNKVYEKQPHLLRSNLLVKSRQFRDKSIN